MHGLTPSTPSTRIQQGGDPYPGMYVSTSSYKNWDNKNQLDPRRNVDAANINYVVWGNEAKRKGANLGDYVAVHYLKTNVTQYGVIGDAGNSSGAEGSLALVQRLGHQNASAGNGIDSKDVIVRYFPDTRINGVFTAHSQRDIDATGWLLNLDVDFSTQQKEYDKSKRN